MAVPHNARATGMNVSESHRVTCVLHQQLLHLRRPAMAGSLEYRSLEVGHVMGQRKPTMTTTKLLSLGCGRDQPHKQMLAAVLAGKESQGAAVVPPVSSGKEAGSSCEQWLMGMSVSCSIGDPPQAVACGSEKEDENIPGAQTIHCLGPHHALIPLSTLSCPPLHSPFVVCCLALSPCHLPLGPGYQHP